jgi:hypothetical protein
MLQVTKIADQFQDAVGAERLQARIDDRRTGEAQSRQLAPHL